MKKKFVAALYLIFNADSKIQPRPMIIFESSYALYVFVLMSAVSATESVADFSADLEAVWGTGMWL